MSALQQMAMNMIADVLKNLPPDVQEKIDTIGSFVARIDGRLSQIESDLAIIKSKIGETKNE